MVVITVRDFDPSGWQMPISIGRNSNLHDLHFPDLRFEVVPAGLNPEQVRDLGLPSTPLKESERRADKWKDALRSRTDRDRRLGHAATGRAA